MRLTPPVKCIFWDETPLWSRFCRSIYRVARGQSESSTVEDDYTPISLQNELDSRHCNQASLHSLFSSDLSRSSQITPKKTSRLSLIHTFHHHLASSSTSPLLFFFRSLLLARLVRRGTIRVHTSKPSRNHLAVIVIFASPESSISTSILCSYIESSWVIHVQKLFPEFSGYTKCEH